MYLCELWILNLECRERCCLSHLRIANKLFRLTMVDSAMELRLIPEFSGDSTQNVVEWLEKAELVCKLRGVAHLESVIPLRLTGGAFAVYQQLPDADKQDVGKITKALRIAFAVDSFTAYEQFVGRRLQHSWRVSGRAASARSSVRGIKRQHASVRFRRRVAGHSVESWITNGGAADRPDLDESESRPRGWRRCRGRC